MYLPPFNLSEVERLVILLPLPEWNYFSKKIKTSYSFKYLDLNFKSNERGGLMTGPLFSSPQISLLLEILTERGLKEILALGWAGKVFNTSLKLGDLFFPVKAYSLEGTSKFYFKDKKIFSIDNNVKEHIEEKFIKSGISFKKGNILTVDAPMRVEKATNMFNLYLSKVMALDMETSALYAIAQFFGLKALMLTLITDEIGKTVSIKPESILKGQREKLIPVIEDFLEKGFNL